MVDYEDLGGPDGGDINMGGVKQKWYFAPKSYFQEIKKVATVPTDMASRVNIVGNHTFKAGKGFHQMYNTLDKGGVKAESQGERDGRSMKLMAKTFYPGSEAALHGVASVAKDDQHIVLMVESDGGVIQIGSEDYPAEIVGSFSTGETTAGLRGYEFDINSVSPHVFKYPGTITLFEDEQGS